ncbi:ABC transporter ATP-binding protein [Rhodospirillum rubrum]|uniref:ABC transporter component n=1 Tax=Rhodospirillum rubrum (strain ATCC 11170 / ATH 1.1.1 / DSM 467 / LMG 4362 / NCIMB 8255 / S1) TaxID=269796 RepID=Q2RT25_RHORT|nr:ABC transporter ATP-binding protein [Rhodospirillum rubrum]ABC22720.1 ABC transporter component [Rhodospirillum rubrum ATCC 11170]AEO48440.1 ABC transporter protein [Rhodospirillum rubrum F11]MBK5954319.1 ABC transporter ATP-binding protein [Rhodospirillum rubrum]QXG78713.1 ABC transporter ATP-binding protein [Rhodospirillum rubrum]HAP98743.1 ABC transporter ATP-binding protein [Rhodospirillum rubrum]
MSEPPLIDVDGLNVSFSSDKGTVHAVRDVSFTLGREKLAIVGESGSGKSQTGRAILGLTPGKVSARRMSFHDIDLRDLSARGWRSIRGKRIGMVMQDPKYSLNPVMTIGEQLMEAARPLADLKSARLRSMEMLEAVRIRDPERVFRAWPHELSGGMGQRAMIAMMLLPEPEVLIADEPTSALDVTVRLQVLAILDDLVRKRDMGLIFISHDLNLVRTFSDRVLIMVGGRIVETLAASALEEARHPYTRGLLACVPDPDHPRERLATLVRDPAWTEQ